MTTEQITYLDPTKVQAEGNIRYQLSPFRIDSLMESIIEQGGVKQPVEVQRLPKPMNGFTHSLTTGFYRHAAVLKLNADKGAGLTLPAIERTPADALARLKSQVSENQDRENLSPMDEAIAVKQMLDAEIPRADIRKAFARPGGKKGITLQPASNSHINMVVSFLSLPKAVQQKIHDGRLGTKAAYELTKVPKEQQAEILTKAEEARLRAIDNEEKADARLDKAEQTEAEKAAEAAAKVEKLAAAEQAVLDTEQATKDADAANKTALAAEKLAKAVGPKEKEFGKSFGEWDETQKKAFAEGVSAAKANTRGAAKVCSQAAKDHDKAKRALLALTGKPAKAPLTEDEKKATRGASRSRPKTAPTQDDIRKAAKEVGVATSKAQALNAAEARDAAGELAKSKLGKVKAIGQIVLKMLSGELTPKQAETDLSIITGEKVAAKKS